MSKQDRKISFKLFCATRQFGSDERGNVALLFGLMSVLLFMAIGGSLDFARAYMARQKLSQIATLACQYASRPAIVGTATSSYGGTSGGATYISNVQNYIATTWQTQKVNLTQTNALPFTYVPGGAADVSLTTAMPAMFIQIFGIPNVGLSAQSHCYDNVASITQRVPEPSGQYVLREGFEAGGPAGTYTFYKPTGSVGTQGTPTGYTATVGYTGSSGTQWHITGFCLEQDSVGVIKSTVAEGSFSVELDCDNGAGSKGNSSITTQTYLAAGTYELRYNYVARVNYPNYNPTYLCGSTAADLSWATDTNSQGGPVANALRSNQLNVYLDLNNASTNAPPNHSTSDGTQLDGSNLIDMCVYSTNWVERSVDITVGTPGYYWLTFAADGTSDSYGGQLDNIRFCRVSCPGSVQDNFPTAWSSSPTLFQDTFESPTYAFNGNGYTENGNMFNSNGTSGASGGWPGQTASGWASAPYNKTTMWSSSNYTNMCPNTNSECVELSGSWNTNSLMSRPFLLDAGYYQVSYKYISVVSFANVTTTYCGTTPINAGIPTLSATNSAGLYINRNGNAGTKTNDTNTIGVFLSHAQLASTPNATSTYGAATNYTNPNGTTSTSPTVAPNGISLTSYNASQVNPLLDICGYAATWQSRSRAILIQKPGYYWLTVSDLATSDGIGGVVDDVKLTVLGSPYMSSPPSGAVSIPVPNPQPGSTVAFTGFTITANPLMP